MKHTPAPWMIDEKLTDLGAPMITAETCWKGQKRIIAKVFYHSGSEDPEVHANARLIAAAPDLLEVAKKLAFLEDECGGWSFPSKADCEFARKAIAKAEGKE